MDPRLISESILRGIEERRRRRQAGASSPPPPAAPKLDPEVVSACSAELDRTIRDSIASSFTQWQVALVPEVEGWAKRVVTRQAKQAQQAAASAAVPPAKAPAPRASAGSSADGSWESLADAADSWVSLTEAVRSLRDDWDQDSFESTFGGMAAFEAMEEAQAASSGAAPAAPAETAAGETAARETAAVELLTVEAMLPVEASAAAAEPIAAGPIDTSDLEAAINGPPAARRETAGMAVTGIGTAGVPVPIEQSPPPPAVAAVTVAAVPIGVVPIPPVIGALASDPSPSRDELAEKLDELIRLVKNSMHDAPPGKPPPLPYVPPELTREIAREVAGRLRDTLAARETAPPAGSAAEPAPKPDRRIPMDDVASIIDQITGGSPP